VADDNGGYGWIADVVEALGVHLIPSAEKHVRGVLLVVGLTLWGVVGAIAVIAVIKNPDPIHEIQKLRETSPMPKTPKSGDNRTLEQRQMDDGSTIIDVPEVQ
jgi:hypothetical protein